MPENIHLKDTIQWPLLYPKLGDHYSFHLTKNPLTWQHLFPFHLPPHLSLWKPPIYFPPL